MMQRHRQIALYYSRYHIIIFLRESMIISHIKLLPSVFSGLFHLTVHGYVPSTKMYRRKALKALLIPMKERVMIKMYDY